MSRPLLLVAAAYTTPGRRGGVNEDTISLMGWQSPQWGEAELCVERPCSEHPLVVLADGMGGHSGGEVASREVANQLYNSLVDSLEANLFDSTVLPETLQSANDYLADRMEQVGEWDGMGTTVAAVMVGENPKSGAAGARILNVGDSRVYLWLEQSKRLRLVSTDDVANPATGSTTNVITQAIGGTEARGKDIEVHQRTIRNLMPGDSFVVCTDGVTDVLDIGQLEYLCRTTRDPEQLALSIGKHSYAKESKDNISVVVAKLTKASSEVVDFGSKRESEHPSEPGSETRPESDEAESMREWRPEPASAVSGQEQMDKVESSRIARLRRVASWRGTVVAMTILAVLDVALLVYFLTGFD